MIHRRSMGWIAVATLLMSWSGLAVGQDVDSAWPQVVEEDGHRVVMFQPQIESWEHNALEGVIALEITPEGQDQPLYGALYFAGKTRTDLDTRVVTLYELDATRISIPTAGRDKEQLVAVVKRLVSREPRHIDMDWLLASFSRTQRVQEQLHAAKVSCDPPEIITSNRPAILVQIDGRPVLEAIQGTSLMYVVNTYWDIFLDQDTGRYYLLAEGRWLTAEDLEKGAWQLAEAVPESVSRIPDEHPRADARKVRKPAAADAPVPDVYVTTGPADLITFDGEPTYTPVGGTRLLAVSNTESQVFKALDDRSYYVLLSGRWFRASTLEGPWESVAPGEVPRQFARVGADGPYADVLVSVPDTPQAREAVIVSQIPREATISRSEAHLDVTYDGVPQFKQIEGTNMTYAVNTEYDVIRSQGKYYCCYQGAWFVSDTSSGPWAVCDDVPEEIYTMPPTSPLYQDTYVYVYDSSGDDVVVGYTSGYLGEYVCDGVVVYGTGYHYPPYVSRNHYYGYPWTYGVAARYHYYTGGYIHFPLYRNPYHRVWVRAGYRPASGRLVDDYYHRHSAYRNWASVATEGGQGRGARAAAVRHRDDVEAEEARRRAESAARPRPAEVAQADARANDVFVGRDGRIYRRGQDGWRRYTDSGWSRVTDERDWATQERGEVPGDRGTGGAPAALPRMPPGQVMDVRDRLDREWAVRDVGTERVRDFRAWRGSQSKMVREGHRALPPRSPVRAPRPPDHMPERPRGPEH